MASPVASKVAKGFRPIKECEAQRSPPSTLSSKKACGSSSKRRNKETGVSASAMSSQMTGTRVAFRAQGAEGLAGEGGVDGA